MGGDYCFRSKGSSLKKTEKIRNYFKGKKTYIHRMNKGSRTQKSIHEKLPRKSNEAISGLLYKRLRIYEQRGSVSGQGGGGEKVSFKGKLRRHRSRWGANSL